MDADPITRREALGAMLGLPVLCSVAEPSGKPPWPAFASSWDDAAAGLASWEEGANERELPLTFERLEYEAAIQFGEESILIFGMRGWHNFRRHLREGSTWDVLGAGISCGGEAWGVFVRGVLSEAARQELRDESGRREERQRRAELMAKRR